MKPSPPPPNKKLSTVLLALGLGCIALAVFAGYEYFALNDIRMALAAREKALAEARQKISSLEERIKALQHRPEIAQSAPSQEPAPEAPTESTDSQPITQAAPEAPPQRRDGREAFREMMRGPMGQLLAGSNVGRMYADLFKEMNLTPQEKEQLRQILVEAEQARMTSSRRDPQARAQMDAKQQEINAKLQGLLGDQRYGQYQTYVNQTGERMAVSQFESSLALSSSPLTSDQKKQMVQIISEERSKSSSGTDVMQSTYNRLGTVLNPTQLSEYSKWQSAMSQMPGFGRGRMGGGGPGF